MVRDQLTAKNSAQEPKLDGAAAATLADALHLYAHLYSLNKGGGDAQLNRINYSLQGAGQPRLRRAQNEPGKFWVTRRAAASPPPRCAS